MVKCVDNLKTIIISLTQYFEADFLWKVSFKIMNSGLILKTVTHVLASGYFYHLLITFSKSFNPDQAPIELPSWSRSKQFATLIDYLKEFFEKLILKKSADNIKSMKNYPACKELN